MKYDHLILYLGFFFFTVSTNIFSINNRLHNDYKHALKFYKMQKYTKCLFYLDSIPLKEINNTLKKNWELWSKIYSLQGNCLKETQQIQKAIPNYLNSLKFQPKQPDLWLIIATYYDNLKLYFKSIPFYKKYISYYNQSQVKSDNFHATQYKFAFALAYEGKKKEALRELKLIFKSQQSVPCKKQHSINCWEHNIIYYAFKPHLMQMQIKKIKHRLVSIKKDIMQTAYLKLLKKYTSTLYLFHTDNRYKWPYFFYLYEYENNPKAKIILKEIKKNTSDSNQEEKDLILYFEASYSEF